ncbi:MAG: caspase family protein [Clostridiales bacterium]|nr:caspase family protein [Candidatus Blautia equi]
MSKELTLEFEEDLINYLKKRYSADEILGIGNRIGIDRADYYAEGQPLGPSIRNLVKMINQALKVEKLFTVLYEYYKRPDLDDVVDGLGDCVNRGMVRGYRNRYEAPSMRTAVELKKGLKAILIGCRHYYVGDGANDLPNAEKDAIALGEFFKTKWDVPEEDIHLFAGEVFCEEIKKKIEEICNSMTASDKLFFFFAGHGEEIDGHTVLLPTDVMVGEKGFSNDIPMKWLNDVMKKCRASYKVRVFDACHCGERFSRKLTVLNNAGEPVEAGELKALLTKEDAAFLVPQSRALGDEEGRRPATARMMREFMPWDTDWVTFCSCSAKECSYDIPNLNNGVFSFFFLQGLNGEARRGDGPMYIEDLRIYVTSNVPAKMALYGLRQHPQYQCEVQENIIVG